MEEIQEYIKEVKEYSWNLRYVPAKVKVEHPEICIEAVKNDGRVLRFVPESVQMAHPEMCIEAVKNDGRVLQYVPESVRVEHPEICIEAVKNNAFALEFVPKSVQMEYPEMCIEAVKTNPFILQDVPESVKVEHPEICIEAVKDDGVVLKYVPESVRVEHPEMCIEAVKTNYQTWEYVPESVQMAHPEMCIEAVKTNPFILQYVPESVRVEHPEICIEAVKNNAFALEFVPKSVQMEYPEMCIEAVKDEGFVLQYVPESVRVEHPEMCIEAVKNNALAWEYVPESVQEAHSEICIEAVKNDSSTLKHIADSVQLKYTKECMDAVYENGYGFRYISKEILYNNIGFCMNMVKDFSGNIKFIPEEILDSYPELVIEAVKYGNDRVYQKDQYNVDFPNNFYNLYILKYLPENYLERHNEVAVEFLKFDVNAYLDKEFDNIRNTPEVLKFMFEDIDAIKRIKEKSHFDVKDRNENSDYDEKQMDIFYYQMIKSIGIDEVEKLVDIPTFTKEQIEEYHLQYNERIHELFEKNYKLTGEIGAVADIFRGINLSEYESKGKNIKFEIFKNLNLLLEQDNNLTIEELLRKSIQNSGLEVNEKIIEKLSARKNTIVKELSEEKFSHVKGELEQKLSASLTSQQLPVEKIIEKAIKKSMQKGEGEYNIDDVVHEIEGELSRTRENGQDFYSHHITSQKDDILDVTREFLSDKGVERALSKSLSRVLKDKKQQIGTGWIRKLQDIPVNLGKDEYEILEKRLGIKLESTYEIKIKDGINEEEVYKILSENQVPGVLTYNQVELMFSEIREPYSEEFKKYYKQHKEEILSRPEIYSKLSRIHNNFEEIIHRPEVINRYKAGDLSLDNIITIISEQKYENVRPGNEMLAEVAANSGLDKEYFESAQKVYEITRKREGTTIPQLNVQGRKYRGRILRADDPLNLFAGDITTCCQRFGGVGEGSMMHAATEQNGAIFIIEEVDEEGKTIRPIAQSWTWRNKSRLCYDNIEIKNEILAEMTKEEQKEIMDIYIEAGEKAIETDEKVMSKLLKEGKITQEVYDEVVLTEVTCGTGYNDLDELTKRIETGELKESEEIILPKEADKNYKGYNNNNPWIDSKETQITLAAMEEEKIEKIRKRKNDRKERREEISNPIIYQNTREVDELKGNFVMKSDVDKIKKVERTVYREEQQILQNCENIVDVADNYGLDVENMEVIMSKDGDWYMIGEEFDKEYYIADLAMVGGVNSRRNEKADSNAKIATFEIAEKMYEKMIEMAKKGKNIRYEATRDTSYVNTQNMQRKGLIEVLENEDSTFGSSDIKMNNVVVKPNLEELEEELRKVRETLAKLKEKGLCKVKIKQENDAPSL